MLEQTNKSGATPLNTADGEVAEPVAEPAELGRNFDGAVIEIRALPPMQPRKRRNRKADEARALAEAKRSNAEEAKRADAEGAQDPPVAAPPESAPEDYNEIPVWLRAGEPDKARELLDDDDTGAPTSTKIVDFDAIVREGKQVVAELRGHERRGQLRLGELADLVETHYGQRDLKRFAGELGIAACTLGRYRDVYRAWDGAGIRAPGRISYTVMRELAANPKRAEIVAESPNLTKAEARDKMREFKGGQENNGGQEEKTKTVEASDGWEAETKRWFRELVTIANAAVGAASIGTLTPERKRALRAGIEPKLLGNLEEGGAALIKIAEDLRELLDQDEDWDQQEAAPAPEVPPRTRSRAKSSEQAKNKARKQAQHDAMENDVEDAKAEAKENGERWGDIKEEWIAEWIADNWGEEQEAEFEEQWAREHGATHNEGTGGNGTNP
jgi:hypothetical protein